MKETPILFHARSMEGIRANRKTQTRRLNGLKEINARPNDWRYDGTNTNGDHLFFDVAAAVSSHEPPDCIKVIPCPYGKAGDRIYAKETHYLWGWWARIDDEWHFQYERNYGVRFDTHGIIPLKGRAGERGALGFWSVPEEIEAQIKAVAA